jgi:hypothetical protein
MEGYKIQFAVRAMFQAQDKMERDWYISQVAETYSDEFLKRTAELLDEKLANYSSRSSGYNIQRLLEVTFICIKYNTI